MRALVMYESEFGATRAIAEAISRGLRASGAPEAIDVDLIDSRDGALGDGWTADLGLLVVGAPTHARGLPSPATRHAALDWPAKPGSRLRLEPHVEAAGMRERLEEVDLTGLPVATFITRMDMSRLLAGSAAPALGRLIGKAGGTIVAGPEEFLVAKDGSLVAHELDHAYEWGRGSRGRCSVASTKPPRRPTGAPARRGAVARSSRSIRTQRA